jgi:predicted nucleotidyltransferase
MTVCSTIQSFLEQCLDRFKSITSIWLFGSRANNSFREDSDWDLLIFADEQTLDLKRMAKELKRSDVDVLVVYDGKNSEEPWPEIRDGQVNPKRLSLYSSIWNGGIEWNQFSTTKASYQGTKDGSKVASVQKLKARRLWPSNGKV